MSSSVERDKVEDLRRDAENDEWLKVIQAYKQESTLRTAKITPTGDTVLHMAVSNGVENIVADMVDFLVQEEKSTTQDIESRRNKKIFLGVENDRKDTPLHLAGAMGNDRICEKIGRTDPSLIASRNINGETPLFLAAFYGWRRSFLWLHYLYKQSHEVSSTDFALCIRDNHDNNILHCAIAGGHFDVAIEIVHLYKDHLMRPNKEGLTPLFLLVAQRSAFKTAALLEVTSLLHPIYWCWKVEEKKHVTTFEELRSSERDTTGEESFLSKFAKLVYFLPVFLIGFLLVEFSEAGVLVYRAGGNGKTTVWYRNDRDTPNDCCEERCDRDGGENSGIISVND
ncbi:hypothetical protein K1719_047482 [Acacia pycnantha]|nr:hypothetical protein K1719_047482 [Acacia pycnantha]